MEERSHFLVLAEFMEGLNMMTDASSQLIHQFQNPKFMAVRDMLNLMRDHISKRVAMDTVKKHG